MSCIYSTLILLLCILLGGCTFPRSTTLQQPEEDNTDLSCSYFYFLWGSHAESNEHYREALEAYQKALICDQKADYVQRKLPVLLLKMGETDKAIDWLEREIRQNPLAIQLKLFLANLYARQNKADRAIQLYNAVLEMEPDNEDVQFRLAFLYSYKKEYSIAEEKLRLLLKKNDEHYFAHFYLARTLKREGKIEEAGKEYEKALALNWSRELAFEIGQFYAEQNQYDNALRIYSSASRNDPDDERASLSRIQVLLDMGSNDKALKELKEIRKRSRDKTRIDIIAAKILLRKKDFQAAESLLLDLVNKTEKQEPHYLLAMIYFQNNNFSLALHHLQSIVPSSVIFEEAVYLQTRILRKLKKPGDAINLLEKHISSSKSRSPLFYALLSVFYQGQKKNNKALSLLAQAVHIYPENPQLFFEYGLLLEKNGKHQQAMTTMQKVIELKPDHAEALNFIGYTWADSNMHLKEALKYIEKAAQLKPGNGYILDSLGWVHYRLGNLEKAKKEILKALELEPADPHIFDHLGDIYNSLKQTEMAVKTWKKAYEMFKDEKKRDQVKQKIRVLENRE
ncbi:tetratricopeptide repeat protein [Desulfomarina sp.]